VHGESPMRQASQVEFVLKPTGNLSSGEEVNVQQKAREGVCAKKTTPRSELGLRVGHSKMIRILDGKGIKRTAERGGQSCQPGEGGVSSGGMGARNVDT